MSDSPRLASSHPRRAYLLDMDGVVVHSATAEARAWQAFAARYGLPMVDVERGIASGGTTRAVIAQLAPGADSAEEAAQIDARQITDTAGVVALPGASQILTGPVPAAIVTATSRPVAIALMTAAQLACPAVMVTAEQLNGAGKAAGYRLAAAALKVKPTECVAFEDTPGGVEGALEAGCHVVGITTTHPAGGFGAHEYAESIAAWLSHGGRNA